MINSRLLLLFVFLLAGLLPLRIDATAAEAADQAERAQYAANIIRQLMNTPESNIPDELLEHAHAIAVIPNLVKAAFGVGGFHGKGLIAGRTDKAWGTPAFIDLNGGSFGFQIGVSSTDPAKRK